MEAIVEIHKVSTKSKYYARDVRIQNGRIIVRQMFARLLSEVYKMHVEEFS